MEFMTVAATFAKAGRDAGLQPQHYFIPVAKTVWKCALCFCRETT
jgi:hypothetical protein